MSVRSTVVKLAAGLLVLSLAGGGAALYVASDFQQPTVESVENSFGAVDASGTQIDTRVVLDNPNDRSPPGPVPLTYTVEMNGVTMARGSSGMDLRPGRNVLNLTTTLDNGQIPEWWVTHVENDETTKLVTKPSISVAGLPVGASLPAQERVIRTDLLGSFENAESRTVSVAGRSILVVSNQTASWGEVSAERTPIEVRTDLENVHDRPVRLDGTAYRIEMNDVVVANGTTDDSIRLQPGEEGTFVATPAIEADRMEAWWVSHLQANQTTRMSVEVYGLVEKNGSYERVPLTVYERRAELQTDFLGGGDTTVEVLDSGSEAADYEQPRLVATDSEWGETGDQATAIRSRVVIGNPNDGQIGDLVALTLRQDTSINGVPIADATGRLPRLKAGNNSVTLVSVMPHDTVPVWWARHLDRGERTTVTTSTGATADIGVTTLDVDVPDRERTLTTNLLDGFDDSTDEEVRYGGRTVLVVRQTSASWGDATAERAPIDVAATIENEQEQTVTIRDLTYNVRLNGVSLAENRSVGESYTIGPHSVRTIRPRLVLDNSKMAEWWPTHVDNGEASQLTTTVYATVETPFGTETMELDSLSQNRTVETDVFG